MTLLITRSLVNFRSKFFDVSRNQIRITSTVCVCAFSFRFEYTFSILLHKRKVQYDGRKLLLFRVDWLVGKKAKVWVKEYDARALLGARVAQRKSFAVHALYYFLNISYHMKYSFLSNSVIFSLHLWFAMKHFTSSFMVFLMGFCFCVW